MERASYGLALVLPLLFDLFANLIDQVHGGGAQGLVVVRSEQAHRRGPRGQRGGRPAECSGQRASESDTPSKALARTESGRVKRHRARTPRCARCESRWSRASGECVP